jgi:hypothetical protein
MQYRAYFWESEKVLFACCHSSIPSIHKHNLSTFLVRVSCVFLTLEKLCHGVLFLPFIQWSPAYFSSRLSCCRKATHIKWRSCSNFFDSLHLDACNCTWQSTGDLFFLSRIQVACLACVLIGSLAKLLSSFCKRSVLAPCRWLMLSLARWSHQWLSFGF